jgi:hypothetical protein
VIQLPAVTLNDVWPGLALATWLCLGCIGLLAIARHKRGRMLRRIGYWLLLAYSVELVIAAILLGGEGIWAGVGAAGVVGTAALAVCGPRLWNMAEEAEVRRIAARDCF